MQPREQTDVEFWIEKVGRKRFEQACAWAWKTAAGCGVFDKDQGPDSRFVNEDDDHFSYVPHELCDLWYSDHLSEEQKLDLAFELYLRMPCYANLMDWSSAWEDRSASSRSRILSFFRQQLSGEDDRLADPIAYTLWCDFFEVRDRVADAWCALVTDQSPDRLLERILLVAGPVPWTLKVPLYQRLLPAKRWHTFLFKSLLFSKHDVYGQINAKEALDVLSKLTACDDPVLLDELKEALTPMREKLRGFFRRFGRRN